MVEKFIEKICKGLVFKDRLTWDFTLSYLDDIDSFFEDKQLCFEKVKYCLLPKVAVKYMNEHF